MRYLLAPLVALFILGACLQPTTQQALNQELTPEEIQKLYTERPDLMLAVFSKQLEEYAARANIYAAQPWCTEEVIVLCADPEVVVIIDDIAKEGEKALLTAKAGAAVASNGMPNPVAMATLRLVLSKLYRELVARGI